MINTFCTNIFIKNKKLWPGQCRVGQLVIYNLLIRYNLNYRNHIVIANLKCGAKKLCSRVLYSYLKG